MNPSKQFSSEKLQAIGQHEAGHYIVNRSYGVEVISISIELTNAGGGYNGGCKINLCQPLRNEGQIVKYLENRCIGLYAGVISESIEHDKLSIENACAFLNQQSAKGDADKIGELIQLLRNIQDDSLAKLGDYQEQLNYLSDELWKKAIDRVEIEKELIVGIGRRLACELKKDGTRAVLSPEDFSKMTSLQKRFVLNDENAT